MKKKVCWSAIGSDSQKLVDTQKLVAHWEFCCTFFFISQCFWSFLTMRALAQACLRWSKYTTKVCFHFFLFYYCLMSEHFHCHYPSILFFHNWLTDPTHNKKHQPHIQLPQEHHSVHAKTAKTATRLVLAKTWSDCPILYRSTPSWRGGGL